MTSSYSANLDKTSWSSLGRGYARHPRLRPWDYGMTRVARWPVFHRPGRYFIAKLAEAGKRPVFRKSVPEAGIVKINNLA